MKPISDPELLAQLNGSPRGVSDPLTLGMLEYGIDFSQPENVVRDSIGKLRPEQIEPAIKTWAAAQVANERARGIAPNLPNPAANLPFFKEAASVANAGLNAVTGGRLGRPYGEALAYEREKARQQHAATPTLSTIGDIMGGLALPLGGSPAATTLGRIGQGVGMGAGYGALYGAAEGDPGLAGRLEGAAAGGLAGAALGGIGAGAAEGIARRVQHVAGARAAARSETSDAGQGALLAANRALERDRISPDSLVAQIREELPRSSLDDARRSLTPDQVETLVRMQSAQSGTSDIATALGVADDTVRRYAAEMVDRSRGPLNLVDRASLVRTGAGDNTQMTLRAAAATPGEARGIARERLLERSIGANGRLAEAFDRIIGSSDFEGVATRHSQTLQEAGNAAYQAAYAAEKPFDLAPIFTSWSRSYGRQRGPVPDAVNAAIDSMMTKAPIRDLERGMVVGHELVPPRSLESFINARQNLSAAIEKARDQPSVQRLLTKLREELSGEVRRANPAWGTANDIWRDGRAAQDAMEAGSRMALRLNSSSRELLKEFVDAQSAWRAAQPKGRGQNRAPGDEARAAAAQARMDLFKVGLVRGLTDLMANQNATNDITRSLRLPAARSMLSTVLGKKDAATLFRTLDAEHAMHRTYSSQFGSQTTPLREAIDDLNWAPRMSSALDLMDPRKAMQMASEWIAAKTNAQRNASLMPLLTETDIMRQLEILRSIGGINTARAEAMFAPARMGMIGAGLIGQRTGSFVGDRRW